MLTLSLFALLLTHPALQPAPAHTLEGPAPLRPDWAFVLPVIEDAATLAPASRFLAMLDRKDSPFAGDLDAAPNPWGSGTDPFDIESERGRVQAAGEFIAEQMIAEFAASANLNP